MRSKPNSTALNKSNFTSVVVEQKDILVQTTKHNLIPTDNNRAEHNAVVQGL